MLILAKKMHIFYSFPSNLIKYILTVCLRNTHHTMPSIFLHIVYVNATEY